MAKSLTVPLVSHDQSSWACLSYFSKKTVICAESFSQKQDKYSFLGGHRVRLYSLEGNVHWKIPLDTAINIEDVKPAQVPARRQGGKAK